MAHFPLLQELQVDGYSLYPGGDGVSGLEIKFKPGLTFVLGANGLGKTTLIWLLYRMLTGPYDISGLSKGELGDKKLKPSSIRGQKRMFAQRVQDNAADALATLVVVVGGAEVTIRRRLDQLTLVGLDVDGEDCATDEAAFQQRMSELAGVGSFADWILLLRYLTFYFEDRRELVWDSSAQKHVLRLLFLTPELAQRWITLEREILELDSESRGLSAVLFKQKKRLQEEEDKLDDALDIRTALKTRRELQEQDEAARIGFLEASLELKRRREAARLRALQARQAREATFRALERAKFTVLESRFPSASTTALYILAQLMTEGECLACGSKSEGAAAEYEARLEAGHCVVCNSVVATPAGTADLGNERLVRLVGDLESADLAVADAQAELDQANAEHQSNEKRLAEVESVLAERDVLIQALVNKLPKDEGSLHADRMAIPVLERRVRVMREELKIKRASFKEFIEEEQTAIVERAARIKTLFGGYAEDFLLEKCELVWRPKGRRVGQTGIEIEYPAFELQMSSGTFELPVRRDGPTQVSESQREFIDLAFRMALMGAATSAGGTLVIDAPESSLDAVFVRRAAQVLGRFGAPGGLNRLMITSNLVQGRLITSLLATAGPSWRERVVDLFILGTPTAAVSELRAEYDLVRSELFDDVDQALGGGQ